MGWNSWNRFGTKVDEALVRETAEAIVATGMREAGYRYVVIDDGWEAGERDAHGDLVADPAKFPHGIRAVADHVHALGLRFGIYTDAGTNTCQGLPASLYSYAGPSHWNDPDMLEIGNGGMTALEYRTHLGLWAMLAAPLMAGNDLRTMTDETRALLSAPEVLAIDQDPLGRQARRVRASDRAEVWVRDLAGGAHTIALANRGEGARDIADALAHLRPPPWADRGRRDPCVRLDLGGLHVGHTTS